MEWAALFSSSRCRERRLLKADWIRYYDTLPDNLRKYGAGYAVTDRGGDFTSTAWPASTARATST